MAKGVLPSQGTHPMTVSTTLCRQRDLLATCTQGRINVMISADHLRITNPRSQSMVRSPSVDIAHDLTTQSTVVD